MGVHDEKHAGAVGEKTADTNSDSAPTYERGEHVGVVDFANDEDYNALSFWGRMGLTPSSFKRREVTDANQHNKLNQNMKPRHLHMIAIGGSIGAGLFVGTGDALATGGPASLVIDYMIIGVMMFNVVFALGEMALMYPVSGGFYIYVSRFVDPSWGFAMGWNYCLQWITILPFEVVVASFTVDYWTQGSISPAVFITIFLVALVVINTFGGLGYAEEEFWSSFLKLTAIITFLVIGLICVCGGGPESGDFDTYQGAKLWYEPGAFNNGFKGFCSVFVTAAFAFSGTELVGLAAAESATPLQTLPSACKQVFWRVTLFYILSLFFVGLLVRFDDPNLIGNMDFANSQGVALRPCRQICPHCRIRPLHQRRHHGLRHLHRRTMPPKIFAYVDRAGRPLFSTILILVFGCLAYAGVDPKSAKDLFDWLLALSGLAALFTWGSICLAHIRFRAAWARQGHTLDEIPFKAAFGVVGSYIGLGMAILVFIAQTYVAISPVGEDLNTATGFFQAMLALFVVLFSWAVGYIWKRPKFLSLDDVDLDTGRREIDWEMHRAIEDKKKNAGAFMRVIYFLF
ncbi:amino-acid permease inda1 [Apiospora phragmitis]|uniref:Amino-acid permease inda1 n=1 Tax=Apiospora phragmitis TaxID=2905665 RepID=A0ABR1VIK0_9PEZI